MIREALDAYATSIRKTFKHDRTQTIGGSEIGQCARRVKYIKTEHKPDDDYVQHWGASERGKNYEDNFFVPALRKKYGKKLRFAGKQQKTFIGHHLSVTPDGMIVDQSRDALRHLGINDIGSDCIMVEAKTVDPRANLEEARRHNVMQANVQLGLVREKTKHKPLYNVLSYTNAASYDDVKEFVIKFDPATYQEAKDRAQKILNAEKPSDLPPEGWIAGGNECKTCPYLKSCGIERRNLPFADNDEPVAPQVRAEISDMVRELVNLDGVIEGYKAGYRAKEDELKGRLRDFGIRKIKGVLNWTTVKGRTSYDNEGIRVAATLAGIDVEKYMKIGDESDRLTLLIK